MLCPEFMTCPFFLVLSWSGRCVAMCSSPSEVTVHIFSKVSMNQDNSCQHFTTNNLVFRQRQLQILCFIVWQEQE